MIECQLNNNYIKTSRYEGNRKNNMKIIGIADFKNLVMERLANPRDYAGRSLVLWNADYMKYGIAYRVIKQCCKSYNNENPNDQVWFKKSDMTFNNDDYTQPKTLHNFYVWDEELKEYDSCCELKRCGILFNTGCYMLYDKEDWLKFVNTHTNQKGGVFQDCVVIVCAQADQLTYISLFGDSKDSRYILKEEQFGNNCDIYSIQPTLDEWVTWVEPDCHPEIFKVVRAYIEKNGIGDEPYGFEYWQRIMDSLNNLVKVEGCPINQIPKEFVKTKIMGAVSTKSPAPEFCDFIYEQDTSM